MKREPFLKMAKREKISWQKRLLIRFIALLLSLIVCAGVIFLLVTMNPMDVYKAIWDGALGFLNAVYGSLFVIRWFFCVLQSVWLRHLKCVSGISVQKVRFW